MPGLLDLPDEILSQIASFATSTSGHSGLLPFRDWFPTHLCTCKRWYNLALPIFYEDLLRSRKLYLCYDALSHFPGNQTQLYQYYSSKLQKISLRLHGQPSPRSALQPFFDNSHENSSCDSGPDSAADTDSDSSDHETAGHACFEDDVDDAVDAVVESARYKCHVPPSWKDELAGHLRNFSDLVSKCESLDEVTFQAFYGFDYNPQPQWDYLDCGAMEYFVLRLPSNVKYLTLDLAGTNVVPSHDAISGHLCPAIARCILNVENVRLRLRHACPSVLGIKSIHSTTLQRTTQHGNQRSVKYVSRARGRGRGRLNARLEQRHFANPQNRGQVPDESINQQPLQFIMHENSRTVGTSRLKSLVLRLSLPQFPADRVSDRRGPCHVRQCRSFQDVRTFGLPRVLALSGRHLLGLEPGIESLKISFKMPMCFDFNLVAFDCIGWNLITTDEGVSCFEDDGGEWEDWENKANVVMSDIPTPVQLSSMAVRNGVFRPARSNVESDDEWEDETDNSNLSGSTADTDDEWTDESEEDESEEDESEEDESEEDESDAYDDGFDNPWFDDSDEEDETLAMGALANFLYPDAAAAGLGVGDIMDLLEHDMIFGSDHTPI